MNKQNKKLLPKTVLVQVVLLRTFEQAMARNKGWAKKDNRSREIVGVRNAKAAHSLGLRWYCPKKRAPNIEAATALTGEQWQDLRANNRTKAISRGGYALRKSSDSVRRAIAQKKNAIKAGRPRTPRSIRRKTMPVRVGRLARTTARTLDVLEVCTIVGRIAKAARKTGLKAVTISDTPLKDASPMEERYHVVVDLNSTEGTASFLTLVHASPVLCG